MAGATEITFRLRFTLIGPPQISDNGTDDHARFEDGENNGATGNLPVLNIRYSP